MDTSRSSLSQHHTSEEAIITEDDVDNFIEQLGNTRNLEEARDTLQHLVVQVPRQVEWKREDSSFFSPTYFRLRI
jgi:hypothetical protein